MNAQQSKYVQPKIGIYNNKEGIGIFCMIWKKKMDNSK